MSSRSGASTGTSEMVPRQLLLDSQDTVERLRRQLDEALATQDSEVNVAVHTLQAQLRAVQKQQKAAEAQLNRSMAREKELREQVVNADVMSKITRICIHTHTHAHTHYLHNTRSRAREHTSTHIHTQVVNADVMSAMSSLRNENKELREQNEKLSEQATKGQEGEAQIIVLRNKLEASREELQRVRSGNELELQSTRMEAAALKKALQQAEMDQIRSEQVLRREKEMQETIDRFAAQLNEKDRQVLQCCSPASRVRTRIAHLTQVPTPNHPVSVHRFLNCKTSSIGQALPLQLLQARHIPGARRSQTLNDVSDTKRIVQRRWFVSKTVRACVWRFGTWMRSNDLHAACISFRDIEARTS